MNTTSEVANVEVIECPRRTVVNTYDCSVSNSRPTRTLIPGGVVATRRSIRRTGGVMALATCFSVWLAGMVLSFLVSGPVGGVISFVGLVLAVPALPVFGIPAAGGSSRFMLAIVVSAVAWWFVGQVAAGRVTRKPVVGRREWLVAFARLGAGLWVGALGGLALGALALGAL